MKSVIRYGLLAFIVLIVGGFFYLIGQRPSVQTSHSQFLITTSFYPLYYFTSRIGGDRVTVKNITPSGSEPHDYEPTPQDVALIERSKLLVLNGGVESWGKDMKENLQGTNVAILEAGDGLMTKQLSEDGKTAQDPHIWLDPTLAKVEVNRIAAAMIQKDQTMGGKNVSYFNANKEKLEADLDQLGEQYKNGLASCSSKDIITSHAAFGYLANAYGLEQVPISGLSPDAEPSPQQLISIADFAKAHNVHYIFFESLVSPKLANTIAQEIGAKTLVLDPLEGIPDDEVGKGKNYFSVMKDNLTNLQIALQCQK